MSEFLKKRWLVMTLLLVVLAGVPALVYFAGRLKTDLREKIGREVQQDLSVITSAGGTLKINYTVPAVAAGPALEWKGPPNDKAIAQFKNWRDQQMNQLSGVVNEALEFNRGQRSLLLEGIFPEPDAADLAIKPLEFRRLYFERAHQDMLKRFRAGGPPTPADVAENLRIRQAELARLQTGRESVDPNNLPPELQAQISEALLKTRLQIYRLRAESLGFYCEVDAFRLPQLNPDTPPPTIGDCWRWQWSYWIREDILKAAAEANRPYADQGIPGAVVKKIESIAIESLAAIVVDPSNPAPPGPYPPGSDAVVPVAPAVSVTGRPSGPNSNNSYYDIRRVTIEIVASTSRLPAFVDALARVNFISVLDCDLSRVDGDEEIKSGFFYGTEPVVRAKMVLETVWLREWMLPLTPRSVRQELMMADPPAPPTEETGQPAPPQ